MIGITPTWGECDKRIRIQNSVGGTKWVHQDMAGTDHAAVPERIGKDA